MDIFLPELKDTAGKTEKEKTSVIITKCCHANKNNTVNMILHNIVFQITTEIFLKSKFLCHNSPLLSPPPPPQGSVPC